MNVSTLPSQDLLRLCLQTHDESLWLEFVRLTQPVIACVVRKTIRHWETPTKELTDDLVQDTYLKLFANDYRALRNFDSRHENALFGFVKKIASNLVHDHFRKENSDIHGGRKVKEDMETVAATHAASVNSAPSIHRKIQRDEIAKRLKEVLAGEPNADRDEAIFWLYYDYGFTAKEISKLSGIGLSVKGVESTLLRLIRKLGI